MGPFEARHTASELDELVSKRAALYGEVRVVMEHTGMYWCPVAMALKRVGFFVSVVLLVGVGTVVHSMVDYGIASVIWSPLRQVIRPSALCDTSKQA